MVLSTQDTVASFSLYIYVVQYVASQFVDVHTVVVVEEKII